MWTHIVLALLFLQTPETRTVSGVVVDAVTGAPVRKAQITLAYGSRTYSASSDASGKFSIPQVEPGSYSLNAEHAGYQRGNLRDLVRVSDQPVGDLKIPMTPLAVISGRVLDENGEPLARMIVSVAREGYDRNGRTLVGGVESPNDDRGEYRHFNLAPGRYYVVATNPSLELAFAGRIRADQIETAYVSTWYPSAAGSSQAAPLILAAGSELTGIDIRMRKVPVHHIRGKVVGGNNVASLWLTPCDTAFENSNRSLRVPVLRDGTFDASGVMAGTWCAIVHQMPGSQPEAYARQVITVTDRDVNDAILTVRPMTEIRGQILVDDAPPKSDYSGPAIRFEPLEYGGIDAHFEQPHSNETFIASVGPAPYRVTVAPAVSWYLKTIRFNGQPVPNDRIDVPAGGGQLTLSFATDAGQLSGIVQTPSGEPAVGIYVTVVAPDFLTASLPGAETGPDGRFLIRGLPPGDCQVVAWETNDRGLIEYAEFRKQFLSRATPATIQPHGQATVTLHPVSAAEIAAARARLP